MTRTAPAAIPHITGRLTFEHTYKVGRTTHTGIFFSVDMAAAKVYAERCNEGSRMDTDSKVRTISLLQAA